MKSYPQIFSQLLGLSTEHINGAQSGSSAPQDLSLYAPKRLNEACREICVDTLFIGIL